MKILSVGNFGNSWDGSQCDEEHIAKALENAGHEVTRWQRENMLGFNQHHFDFALIAQWDGYGPEAIQEIRKVADKVVYWAFDFQADGQPWHERLVKQTDLYLSKPWSDMKYPNWQWLPQDFAPSFLYPVDAEQDINILFTGSYLPWATERIEYLRAVDKRFGLTIHSFTPQQWTDAGFSNVRGPIMDRGLPKLYARAKINLAVDHTITPGYWSDRAAQIMACGGFVMSKYVPGMELIFRDHVTYFHDVDSMLSGIWHFLVDDGERAARARWGQKHSRANLMVQNRVNDLLTIVENTL